jgi:signal transduction histidine kinase
MWTIVFGFIVMKERSTMLAVVENNISAQAGVIGTNSVTALLFDDNKTAYEVLSSLSMSPNIISAILFNKDGQVFAEYHKNKTSNEPVVSGALKEGYYYDGSMLTVYHNISIDSKHIGCVAITTDLKDVTKTLQRQTIYTALIMASAFLSVLLLYLGLHMMIVKPLTNLKNIMRNISISSDYSVRIPQSGSDEIGALVKGFNEMLSQIQKYIKEKNKFLQNLHDGIGGITANIKMLSDMGKDKCGAPDIKRTFNAISELSDEGISEIRSFMSSLDEKRSWHSLAAEMRYYGSKIMEPHDIIFHMEAVINDEGSEPASLLWFNIFRLYKEALNNIVKHSSATNVNVKLVINNNVLKLAVDDNGKVFNKDNTKGRGLANMKARAGEMQGNLTITAENGVSICLEAPIP